MNSMMAAIKAKRGGKPNESYEEVEVTEEKPKMGNEKPEKGLDLEGLIASLDDGQKQELLSLLIKEQKSDPSDIEKGEASPNEKKIVVEKAESEGDEYLSEDDSDDIAMSMVGRHDQRMNEMGGKPRNLAERARMYMADKLTKKGKM